MLEEGQEKAYCVFVLVGCLFGGHIVDGDDVIVKPGCLQIFLADGYTMYHLHMDRDFA